MADFRIDSRMKVKTFKANFKEEFGTMFRIYMTENYKVMADDEATIGSLMTSFTKGGVLAVGGNLRVSNFEKKITELYGVGTQVVNVKNTELSSDNIILAAAGKK